MELFGYAIARRDAGWVADFCPICSAVRAHRVQRLSLALHISLVPVTRGRVEGHEATCLTCLAVRGIEISDFHAIADHCPADLDLLVRDTQPALASDSGNSRPSTLRARLSVLNHQVQHHRGHAELSPRGKRLAAFGLGVFAATVVAVIGGSALGIVRVNRAWLIWIAIAGIAMIVSVLFCMADAYPWFLKTRFRPQLRRALRPLAPSVADLDAALAELPGENVLAGKHFGAARLHEWIDGSAHGSRRQSAS